MPKGHEDRKQSDPLSYSLEEYQVAKRVKRDPKALKTLLQDCWVQSDSKASFITALQEHGFILSRGDRRGFVALDAQGNVYSLSRWLGVKTKELKARLGNPDSLPSIGVDPAQLCIDMKASKDAMSDGDVIDLEKSEYQSLTQTFNAPKGDV